MTKKALFMLSIFCAVFANATNEKYTISVCTTSTLENALACKKNIFEKTIGEVFIVKENERFFTYLNIYDDKEIAKVTLKHASDYVKKQNPFIKQIDEKIVKQIDKRKLFIDLNKPVLAESIKKEDIKNEVQEIVVKQEVKVEPKKNVNQKSLIPLVSLIPDNIELVGAYPYEEEPETAVKEENTQIQTTQLKEIDYGNQVTTDEDEDTLDESSKEELREVSMNEFDKANESNPAFNYERKPTQIVVNSKKADLSNIQNFQQIVIEVDSNTNIMKVKAKINNNLQDIRTYIVSTGKDNIKKPFGDGKISQISLNPVWYPTQDTKDSFAKRGIILPDVVPPNHKYNYMGAAKLNLTHEVDGKSTYRIHGTLNEKTIGTNESAGCIRMKNSDVLQLANLINEFASSKGLDSIKVILY